MSTVSKAVQGLAAFLLLIIAYHYHNVYRPFKIEKLNKLEQMSIVTSATTIYSGLLYLTDDIGEEMKLFIFALILISNAVFLFTWLLGILEAYALLLCEKWPRIAKIFCCWFLKSKRFQRFASSLGINILAFDVKLSPEPLDNYSYTMESNVTQG